MSSSCATISRQRTSRGFIDDTRFGAPRAKMDWSTGRMKRSARIFTAILSWARHVLRLDERDCAGAILV
jgi:hypothetical protein